MYYEEKLINGILHRRSHPESEWFPFTIEKISSMYMDERREISILRQALKEAEQHATTKDGVAASHERLNV